MRALKGAAAVGLVANLAKPAVRALAPVLRRILGGAGVRVLCLKGQARALGLPEAGEASAEQLGRRSRFVVSLGGDGTLLQALRLAAPFGTAVLGVNLGSLGFITPVPAERLGSALLAALRGRFRRAKRALLSAEILRGGKVEASRLALNDVVLLRGASGKLAELQCSVDGRFLASYRADGLIMATPTGSTAYSLAAGGPIVEPRSRVFILSPISPHTLSARPLVLSDRSVLEIQIPRGRGPLHFSSDGEKGFWFKPGERLRLRRFRRDAILLAPPDYDHWELLRSKLGWRGN